MTVAAISGFISRADAGLREPRSVSHAIDPGQGGVAAHYGGPSQGIGSHDECLSTWRGWQRYHMDVHGWVDIAYTLGVCDHGWVLAGRGAGVRTAAQGTNAGNDHYYAAVWLGGQGEQPTREAKSAFAWAVRELRAEGGAGERVRPHRTFKSTACPGDPFTRLAATLDGEPVSIDDQQEADVLTRGDDSQYVSEWQQRLVRYAEGEGLGWVDELSQSGTFDATTELYTRKWQERMHLPATGEVRQLDWIRMEVVLHVLYKTHG